MIDLTNYKTKIFIVCIWGLFNMLLVLVTFFVFNFWWENLIILSIWLVGYILFELESKRQEDKK